MLQQKEEKKTASRRKRTKAQRAEKTFKKDRRQEVQRKKEEMQVKAQLKASNKSRVPLQKRKQKKLATNEVTSLPETRRLGTSRVANNDIDVTICCMCFGSYEDDVTEGNGAEWQDCACGCWFHIDCSGDMVEDNTGKYRYCPYCIEGLL